MPVNSISVALILTVICGVDVFNISPKPNYVFREPNLPTYQTKSRSSYFGYSINLRLSSVFVGAPRAQSSLETQRNINETGAVYRCSFESLTCSPFNYDDIGNIEQQDSGDQLTREKKDYQWLGAVMDGNSSDNERFIVCAPRLIRDLSNDNLMHGLCYWSANTTDSSPVDVKKIAPFKDKGKQTFPGDLFYYTFGELGLSVHVTEDDTVLIGAPGVFNWKGTIVRFKSKSQDGSGGLSRRDTSERLKIQKRDATYYETDVPNPGHWNQGNDSYFGYAVSSGYFEGIQSKHILYAGSAPQANAQRGEVYIFDIVPVGTSVFSTEKSIKIFYTFSSQQMGEYFGYALVSDDFNGDGYSDIAIAAPLYAKDDSYENGAVYVYRNLGETAAGKWSAGFILDVILRSETERGGGRFGMSLGKIGDVNQDGYNDLVVGAPYENNGAVYIYLGGPEGLSKKPNQIIYAPIPLEGQNSPSTFGQSLSKGADIDGNFYMDIAVGSPNAEMVYVFRSYPVVKIVANVIPLTKELKITDTSFKFKACWSLESKYELPNDTGIILQLKLDPKSINRRATFTENNNNFLEVTTTANTIESCLEYDVLVKYSLDDIYQPIEIEMHYQIVNSVPQTDEFCQHCLAVNPDDPKLAMSKIVFNVGCATERCVADLKLTSAVVEPLPYILGSSNSLSIEYLVENSGETAYLTQIKITIFDEISFKKTPPSCSSTQNNKELLCNINNGSPLFKGDQGKLKIDLDTTKLELMEFIVKAYVFSTGDELNETDNYLENIIPLAEFSDIEATGESSLPAIVLEDGIRNVSITHIFEIRNSGPSNVKQLEILLSIPVALIDKWTLDPVYIIEFKNISVKSNYNNQKIDVEWLKTNLPIQILPDSDLVGNILPPPLLVVASDNMNGLNYDSSKVGMEYDLTGGVATQDEFTEPQYRRRRRQSPRLKPMRTFNRYTRSVIQQEVSSRSSRSMSFKNDNTLTNIALNRATIFDCYDDSEAICVDAKILINNFVSGNKAVQLNIKFDVDLRVFHDTITDSKDIFVIKPSVEVRKTGDDDGNEINIIQTHPYTIIYKYRLFTIPIWVYIVSVLGGLLTLTLLTYGMYRLGFFKRAKKEELEQAVRVSQRRPMAEQTSDNEDN